MSIDRGQEQAVRAALAALLDWEEVRRSPQLAKFLRYIVEAKLAGNEQNIKAYAIAVDVFGRAPSFDPQNDPIVRVQARRLRALLDRYYAQAEPGSIRIRLPVGRYVPEFEPRATGPEEAAPADPGIAPTDAAASPADEPPAAAGTPIVGSTEQDSLKRDAGAPPLAADDAFPGEKPDGGPQSTAGRGPEVEQAPGFAARPPAARYRTLLLQVLLGLAVVAVLVSAQALERGWFGEHLAVAPASPVPAPTGAPSPALPTLPVVFVGSFSNLSGVAWLDTATVKLKEAVATDLAGFPDLSVATEQEARLPPPTALVVTGLIRPTAAGIEISALLARGLGSPATWSTAVDEPLTGNPSDAMILDAARLIVSRVAAFRGPLHALGRSWLDQQTGLEAVPNLYTCLLRLRLVGDSAQASDTAVALACFERLLKLDPHSAPALAGWAWLEAQVVRSQAAGPDDLDGLLKPAADAARSAVALLPGNSFVHTQLARVLDAEPSPAPAAAEFVTALALDPADLDARAAYARNLALGGDWVAGVAESAEALGATTTPPGWYHEVPMLDGYRRGDDSAAIEEALNCDPTSDGIAAAVAVAAGARGHRSDIVQQFQSVLLEDEHFRARGIISRLKLELSDSALVAAIAQGLSLAGVSQAALLGPF